MGEHDVSTEQDRSLPPPPEVVVVLGRLGSREFASVEGLEVVTSPDGYIGLDAGQLREVVKDVDDATIVWIKDKRAVGAITGESRNNTELEAPKNIAKFAEGRIVINRDRREVLVDGAVIRLAYQEYELLHYLTADHRYGKVLDRDEIFAACWGYDSDETKTLNVHIRRLRRKFGDELSWVIKTVRGVGYMFNDEPELKPAKK